MARIVFYSLCHLLVDIDSLPNLDLSSFPHDASQLQAPSSHSQALLTHPSLPPRPLLPPLGFLSLFPDHAQSSRV